MTAAVAEDRKQSTGAGQVPGANTRESDILAAVDEFLAVQSEWESDPRTPEVPTEFFQESIEEAIFVANAGDVPAICRDLVTAMGRLQVEWEDYVSGLKVGSLTKHGPRPADSFWAAVRGVINARKGAVRPSFKPPEPVFLLLEQKVSEKQIALIWSVDGQGPFIGPYGPDVAKMREEAKEPGKHTAAWVAEQTAKMQAAVTRLVRRSLERTEAAEEDRPNRHAFVPDPASIEQLLREGQFPQVIAKVKGVTLQEVYAEADRIGLELPKDDLVTQRTASAAVATSPSTAVDQSTPGASLDDRIRELHDSGMGAPEIAKALRGEFPHISPQKAAAVIREKKKAARSDDAGGDSDAETE